MPLFLRGWVSLAAKQLLTCDHYISSEFILLGGDGGKSFLNNSRVKDNNNQY